MDPAARWSSLRGKSEARFHQLSSTLWFQPLLQCIAMSSDPRENDCYGNFSFEFICITTSLVSQFEPLVLQTTSCPHHLSLRPILPVLFILFLISLPQPLLTLPLFFLLTSPCPPPPPSHFSSSSSTHSTSPPPCKSQPPPSPPHSKPHLWPDRF